MRDIVFTDSYDWQVKNGDLVIGDGLLTLHINAIFRDGRAPVDDPRLQPGEDRRGYWAKALLPDAPDGSLLWLIRREKITPAKPTEVARCLQNACAFMIDETSGPAADVVRVEAIAEKDSNVRGRIVASLTTYLSNGQPPLRTEFIYDPENNDYRLKEVSR